MPNLKDVVQELYNISKAARDAESRIAGLKTQLKDLVTTSTRGGTGTQQGIEGAIERLMGGATGATRVGGGAYLSRAKDVQQQIRQITSELSHMEAVLQRLNRLSSGVEIPKLLGLEGMVGTRATGNIPLLPPVVTQYYQQAGSRGFTMHGFIPPAQETIDAEELVNETIRGSVPPEVRSVYGNVYQQLFRSLGNIGVGDLDAMAISRMTQSQGAQFTDLTKLPTIGKANAEGIAQISFQLQTATKEAQNFSIAWNTLTKQLATPKTYTKESLLDIFGEERDVGRLLGVAEKRGGFTEADIKNVKDFGGAYKQVIFEQKTFDGVTKTLNLTMDSHGKILVSTQNKLRNFGDSIVRNITEGLKWTIAIGAIYGPMRKLQEITDLAIKNESELANVAVILGKSQDDMGVIFNEAAKAAAAVGQPIDGVIQAYTAAARATGNISDENERYRVTQQLLVDSLILSKLSTLNQAEAIDTLAGALRQVGLPLDQGATLLNKWVAVSKVANVDLRTLAESFAITSTSATNAGVSYDELNGIIAAVAESTTLSATEAGNAVRAFISGFQTDTAKRELATFGIAVEDSSGKARGFFDIMKEIAALRTEKLIDDAQLNKIGEALGGGARRGAQYVAFIQNLGRVQEVATVSSRAQNDAYDALAIKLDTVQTALTNLGNAFQTLAQTVGNEGGILGILKSVLDITTKITDGLSGMVKQFGDLTPAIAGVGTALALISTQYPNLLPNIASGVGMLAGRAYRASPLGRGTTPTRVWGAEGSRMVESGALAANAFGQKATSLAPTIGVLAAEAFLAYGNIKQGDWAGAAGQVLGGAAGAILGGGPYGALLGSLIGESFVGFVSVNADKLSEDLLTKREGTKKPYEELSQTELNQRLLDLAGGGFIVGLMSKFVKPAAALSKLTYGEETIPSNLTERGVASIIAQIFNPQEFRNYQNAQKAFSQRQAITGGEKEGITTAFSKEVAQESIKNANIINRLIEEQRVKAIQALTSQEITAKRYNDILTLLSGNGLVVSRVFKVLGDEFESPAEGLEYLTNTLVGATEEQINYINQLVAEYADLTNEIETLKEKDTVGSKQRIAELEAERNAVKQTVSDYIQGTAQIQAAQRASQLRLPNILSKEELTGGDYQTVLQNAFQLQAEFLEQLKQQAGWTAEDVQAWITTIAPFFVFMADGYKYITGVSQEFFNQALDKLKDMGQLKDSYPGAGGASQFNIQTLDVSRGDFMAAYNKMLAFVQSRFPQYQLNPQQMGLIFKGNVTDVLHLDNLVMQLALQQIAEIEQKQLDGVYNLPSDASFYVPLQAAKMRPEEGGEGFGGGAAGTGAGAAPAAIDELGKKAAEAARELAEFTGHTRDTWRSMFSNRDQPIENLADSINKVSEEIWQRLTNIPAFPPPYSSTPGEELSIYKYKAGQPEYTGGTPPITEITPALSTMFNAAPMLQNLEGQLSLGFTTIIEAIKQKIAEYFGGGGQPVAPTTINPFPSLPPANEGQSGSTSSLLSEISKALANLGTSLVTSLKLNINSRTTLTVDGRVLADIVKPYLYEDMLKTEGSAGSSVTVSII